MPRAIVAGAGTPWGTITGGFKIGKNVIVAGNLDAYEVIDPSSSTARLTMVVSNRTSAPMVATSFPPTRTIPTRSEEAPALPVLPLPEQPLNCTRPIVS